MDLDRLADILLRVEREVESGVRPRRVARWDYMSELRALLRDARLAQGMTVPQAAVVLGVAPNTVRSWEDGRRPSEPYVEALAAFVGVTTQELAVAGSPYRRAEASMWDELCDMSARLTAIEGRITEIADHILRPAVAPKAVGAANPATGRGRGRPVARKR
jgi:transcriptional regulator with XRE-family HTH domain